MWGECPSETDSYDWRNQPVDGAVCEPRGGSDWVRSGLFHYKNDFDRQAKVVAYF